MKQFSPYAERTKQALLEVLRPHLPAVGTVLELASGSGQHVAWFAHGLPALRWLPTERSEAMRASIDDWTSGLPNVERARALDIGASPWPLDERETIAAIIAIDLAHLVPSRVLATLFENARRILAPGGPLCLVTNIREAGAPPAAPPPAHLAGWTVTLDPPGVDELVANAAAHQLQLAVDIELAEKRRLLVLR